MSARRGRVAGPAWTLVLVAAGLALPCRVAAAPAVDHCYGCHRDLRWPQAIAYSSDVHYRAGVTCAGCHGGDPTASDVDDAMSPARGYLGKIRRSQIPEMCGHCHGGHDNPLKREYNLSDVVDSVMAGVHGDALRRSDRGPQCVSCHGVHDIAPVHDPRSAVYPSRVTRTCATCHSDPVYMRDFNPQLPVDQYQKYLASVHGKRNSEGDPKPATCVSCHSNHMVLRVKDPRSPVFPSHIPATCGKCHGDKEYMAKYDIPTDQYSKYRRSKHGIAVLEKSDFGAPTCNSCHGNHAAAPPGSASVVSVCGNCHGTNAELFQKSAHREVFEKKGLPGCAVCHSNHLITDATDALFGYGPASPCVECHEPQAKDKAALAILRIQGLIDSLKTGQDEARTALGRAEQLGMDVEDAKFNLKDAHQALVQMRVAIHSFKVADVEAVARPGLNVIADAKTTAKSAEREYFFRRQGLGVSTLIVTVLTTLLYLKIKEIERRQRERTEKTHPS